MTNKAEHTVEPNLKSVICSQCSTIAIDESGLCVEHLLQYQQVISHKMAMADSLLNYLGREIYVSTGGLIPLNQIETPPAPFGTKVTTNNLSIANSNIGAVAQGHAQIVDSDPAMLIQDGEDKIAVAFAAFTEAVLDSKELTEVVRAEIAAIAETLAGQTQLAPQQRTKSIPTQMERVRDLASVGGGVLNTWNSLEPLLRSIFAGSQQPPL